MSLASPYSLRSDEYLDAHTFSECFDEEWGNLSSQFLKFEALDYYDEGPDSAFSHYLRGDFVASAKSLRAVQAEDRPFFESAQAKGVRFVRIHSLTLPLTEYLQFEFCSYLLSEELGEEIFFISEEDALATCKRLLPDFVVFDERVLFAHDYGDDGVLRGAWKITNAEVIARTISDFQLLSGSGQPARELQACDPRLSQLLHL